MTYIAEGISKLKKLDNFDEDYELLTEETLNRIVNGHDKNGYIIISASRQDVLNSKNTSSQDIWNENNKRYNKLVNIIKDYKYSYVPVFGGFKELGQNKAQVEKSLIVFPYNYNKKEFVDFSKFLEDLILVAKQFNQEAILVKEPNKKPKYLDLTNNTWQNEFNGITLNDVQKEFFTALKSWKDISLNRKNHNWQGKAQRFSYEESYLEKQPQTIMGNHLRRLNGELTYFNNKEEEECLN